MTERQIILDTETTGLEPEQGHRIVEIGALEMLDRRLTGKRFHRYLDPERAIDDAAVEIHGLTSKKLHGEPKFSEIVDEFLDFVRDAELIIHNAPFDIAFIDHELDLGGHPIQSILEVCLVTDSLALARYKHPGQSNTLDSLCRRYEVDNSQRELHGALLDAEILADVYLMMTGGQTQLFRDESDAVTGSGDPKISRLAYDRIRPEVIYATAEELAEHEAILDLLDTNSGTGSAWRNTTKNVSRPREKPNRVTD
jgi:DNA polymerase-3 subunit epsilon